jgi:hypothetical protein
MKSTYLQDLKRFSLAREWEKLMEQNSETKDREDQALFFIFLSYAEEIRYRLGLATPYASALDRLSVLKQILHSMDPVFDSIANRSETLADVPYVVQALCQFLTDISLDLAGIINGIENQHPELEHVFAHQRKVYAEALEAERIGR